MFPDLRTNIEFGGAGAPVRLCFKMGVYFENTGTSIPGVMDVFMLVPCDFVLDVLKAACHALVPRVAT